MLRLLAPQAVTAVLDVAAWGLFHTVTGYAAHRLGDSRLEREGPVLRLRRAETGGRPYRRFLRIDRWKDTLPEAGALFRGGTSKRRLPAAGLTGLEHFARETRRAELAHWWALCCGPLFALWNPPVATALLVTYGVVVNLPFIAVQRYNRARVQAVATRLRAREPR